MIAPFGALNVRSIKQDKRGDHQVEVGFVIAHLEPPAPPVLPPETVTFPAGTMNIERLDGLQVGAADVRTWLTSQDRDWDTWNLKEYLEYRMR